MEETLYNSNGYEIRKTLNYYIIVKNDVILESYPREVMGYWDMVAYVKDMQREDLSHA